MVEVVTVRAAEQWDDEEYGVEDDFELDCTWCGGDGSCPEGAECEPGWTVGEHACHACGGSGNRRDQRVF